MKLTFLPQDLRMKPMSSLDEDKDKGTGSGGRGSGRILAWAIAFLLLIPGAAFADTRGEFPNPRCPGSGCPDNAQPQ
jgi:hypothetical protein